MKRFARLVAGIAVAAALSLGLITAPAQAMHIHRARHVVSGGCIYKHDKHVQTCIKGTFMFHRMIKHRHRWHKRAFYGPRISAQHCVFGRHPHCWGRILSGPLRSRNAPGRPVRGEHAAPLNYCYQVVCTNPFFWATGVAKGIRNLNNRIVDPCEDGGLKGFAGGVGGNLAARAMLESGAIGETTALAKLSSPQAIAYLSVAGCAAKVAQPASNKVSDFLHKLQRFGQPPRTGVRHASHH